MPVLPDRKRFSLRSALIVSVRVYQRFVSPLFPRRCKYEPTCSAYALSALRTYGLLRGSALASWRLLRCNPFSHGGYDPVEEQTLFRTRPGLSARQADGPRGRPTGAEV